MTRQLALELAEPAPPSFGNFITGSNREVKAALEALSGGRAQERHVYLWGVPGSGRSHLLQSVHGAMVAAGRRSVYVACNGSTTALPDAECLDCLALDDVQRLPPEGQIALFNAFNALRERAAVLVTAGDAPPVQLPLRPDVVTRLGWGLVYQLQALTDEEKKLALAESARGLGFDLEDGVAEYLMTHVARDMGTLLAMVRELDRHSLEAKRRVTLGLVRQLVSRQA